MIGKTYTTPEMTTAAIQATYREIPNCKDCKWLKVPRYFIKRHWKHALCTRPSIPKVYDFVEGKHYTPDVFCDIERNPDYDELNRDRCGSTGKYFELKIQT